MNATTALADAVVGMATVQQDPQLDNEARYMATLSQIAYQPPAERNVSAMKYGLQVDQSLTTDRYTTFVNPQTNEAVLAFRGTSDFDDLAPDAHIAFDSRAHQRFADAENIARQANEKYGGKVFFTGHSLGGTLALHASEKSGNNRAVVFNPGGKAANKGANARVIRNSNDLVSAQYASVAENRMRVMTPAEHLFSVVFGSNPVREQLADHGIMQFL